MQDVTRKGRKRSRRVVAAVALGIGLIVPATALAELGDGVTGQVADQVGNVTGGATGSPSGSDGGSTSKPAPSAPPASEPSDSVAPDETPGQGDGYTPPMHGTNPHGQGTIATVDFTPIADRPLSGDPAAAEDIIVGRPRGEQNANGDNHGEVTVLALFGSQVIGIETNEGQTESGPLPPSLQMLLNTFCTGGAMSACLEVLNAQSSTDANGSTNRFVVVDATLGAPGSSGSVGATAGEANGNYSEGPPGGCSTAHGDSQLANVVAGGTNVASAANTSSDSSACADGTSSTQQSSSVIGLFGTGVPLPATGCANGTPDTAFTSLSPLVSTVCNADDTTSGQAPDPYGVRESLTVFALEGLGTAFAKGTAGASETHVVAPPAIPTVPPTPPQPPKKEKGDNQKGGPAGPGGPDGDSSLALVSGPLADDDKNGGLDSLAFTGLSVGLLLLAGMVLFTTGLSLRLTTAVRGSKPLGRLN